MTKPHTQEGRTAQHSAGGPLLLAVVEDTAGLPDVAAIHASQASSLNPIRGICVSIDRNGAVPLEDKMDRLLKWLVPWLVLVVCLGSGWCKGLQDADRAKVDALCREGMELLKSEDLAGAEERFQDAIEIDEKHAPALVGMGHVHLKEGDLDTAERWFNEARRKKHNYAPAYNGLGLVWRERPKGMYRAIEYFQKALRHDRQYLEARYHIAEARQSMQEFDVKREAEKLIEMDETFAPAYLMLGEWYETWKLDYVQAARQYSRYQSLRPDDLNAVLRLAGVHQKAGAPAKVVELLHDWAQTHPDSVNALPVLAAAQMELDSLDRADATFSFYLDRCEESERALYEDIRLLSSQEEYTESQQTADRAAFLTRFWGDRDSDLTTPVNERQLEHYRRVWFARQNFSEKTQPWDTRGEMYVRFGEPDHRSSSAWLNFQQSLAVGRVKESLAFQLYEPEFVMEQGSFFVTFPVHSKDEVGYTSSPVTSQSEDLSMVPWESWVYVNSGVGGGMEITFTDEFQSGAFDFAPVPTDEVNIRKLATFNRLSPRNVTMRTAARTPDYYQTPANEDPFEFYYGLADFRGASPGASLLEVYTGIPQDRAYYEAGEGVTSLHVEQTVGLLNEETGKSYRQRRDLQYREKGDATGQIGALLPDVLRLRVPPGKYTMEVKVVDKHVGTHGRYRQDVEVEAYPDSGLGMSDLELAWRVEEGQAESRFSRGPLRVVPMPTRTYGAGQSVYLYYEIYNLTRDGFGQTHYRIAYTVKASDGAGLRGIVQLMRLGSGGGERVAVASEQQGTAETETEYVALSLSEYKKGKQVLQVTVTDLNLGETVQKEAVFAISGGSSQAP